MTNTVDAFKKILNFEKSDRYPIMEWASWWDKTIDRWIEDGLPAGLNGVEIMEYFELDLHYQDWIHSVGPKCRQPESHGAAVIRSYDDYYDNVLPNLFQFPLVDNDWKIVQPGKWEKFAADHEDGKAALWFTVDGFFWLPRVLFGIENHLFAFYDCPEIMHDINRRNAEWIIKIVDEICTYCLPEFMTFAEDMSYNNGMMIGKNLFDEFMLPYYKEVIPHIKSKGIKVIIDSDGDITEGSKWFAEAGIEGILPLERQAGVDLNKLRKINPDQIYIGHFDKMVMDKGEDALRNEFERLMPTVEQGGYIISCDHQTPPNVSLEDYKLYIKLLKEYTK